jgi:hypothetical protein
MEINQGLAFMRPSDSQTKGETVETEQTFKSPSHEFAVKTYEDALHSSSIDAEVTIDKAIKIAEMMAKSDQYDSNPFDEKSQEDLFKAFEQQRTEGQSMKKQMDIERNIVSHDMDMDD